VSDLALAESILRTACGDRVRTSFSMAPITSFRIGGPAAIYLEPESESDLTAAADALAAAELPYVVIGKGSNVLVSDRGFPGLVLQLGRGYRWAARDGDRLDAGGAKARAGGGRRWPVSERTAASRVCVWCARRHDAPRRCMRPASTCYCCSCRRPCSRCSAS
jgi:hypothetical protein